MTDHTSQHIRLKDGRKFGFAEWGEPNGKPIFVFNGGYGRLFQPITDLSGIRLITVDRPGIGLSDFHPKRVLLDLPDDVIQLADALKIERFAIIGISQGTPPVAACAYKLPHRLNAVSLVT